MAFGKWKSVGILVTLPDGESFILPVEGGGRLIYEEFDQVAGCSGKASKFFEINTLNLTPKVAEDGEGVEGHLKLNLSDDSATELVEDT